MKTDMLFLKSKNTVQSTMKEMELGALILLKSLLMYMEDMAILLIMVVGVLDMDGVTLIMVVGVLDLDGVTLIMAMEDITATEAITEADITAEVIMEEVIMEEADMVMHTIEEEEIQII